LSGYIYQLLAGYKRNASAMIESGEQYFSGAKINLINTPTRGPISIWFDGATNPILL
jgi:hypothetical protein